VLHHNAIEEEYSLIAGQQRTHAINVGLSRNLRYRPPRSFAPLSRISAAAQCRGRTGCV
jgi:hypothetical protein